MYSLPYGKNKLEFNLPENINIDIIAPINPISNPDPLTAVKNALDYPVSGSKHLEEFNNVRRVSIIVSDKTRPVPHNHLLPPLLDKLDRLGISKSQINIIIGSGTHLPMEIDDIKNIYPSDIIDKYDIYSHNCDDIENLIYIGVTCAGTPVYVNRLFYEADLKIVTGNIEPHHFMGFSGGNKSASIGVTGRETINKNHSMLIDPRAKLGEYLNNPMRQDVEEIGRMIGTNFALNAILNNEKQIINVIAGNPSLVMVEGIKIVREISQVSVKQPYDLVIASPGGYPKDINLYQSQKALTHAAIITKDRGIIILAAECLEGSGSKSFEEFMDGISSCEEAFIKFEKIGFRVGPHKAFQIAREAIEKKIIMVSEMKPELVKKWFIEPSNSIEKAIKIAFELNPNIKRIAIMPGATNTISLLS